MLSMIIIISSLQASFTSRQIQITFVPTAKSSKIRSLNLLLPSVKYSPSHTSQDRKSIVNCKSGSCPRSFHSHFSFSQSTNTLIYDSQSSSLQTSHSFVLDQRFHSYSFFLSFRDRYFSLVNQFVILSSLLLYSLSIIFELRQLKLFFLRFAFFISFALCDLSYFCHIEHPLLSWIFRSVTVYTNVL